MDFSLSTQDLENFLCNDVFLCHNSGGVFPIDKLPKEKTNKKCFIINSDPSFLPGEHWIAIFFPNKGLAEFFDSMGRNPSFYSELLLDFLLKQNSNGFMYNTKKFQSIKSSTCGMFCLYFLYYRIRGDKFSDLINRFGNNLLQNDSIVTDFYSQKN
jgi:hypothetical protein